MSDETHGVEFLAGVLVGALAGAAAALLLAPQSGEQTRALLREKGIELKDQASAAGVEARKRVEMLEEQAKEKAGQLQAQVKHAVDEGKTASATTKEDLLAKAGPQPPTGEVPAA
jgi:gas vesicle protein